MADLTPALLGKYLLVYPVQLAVVLTALALLFRLSVRSGWAWAVTAAGVACFFLRTALEPPAGGDLHYFWISGRDILAGIDPYRHVTCVNPPTAFPLLALLALLPFPQMLVLWTAVTLAGTCALVVLSRRALASEAGEQDPLLAPALGVLTAAVALSVPSGMSVAYGQLSLLTAVVLLLAVWARNRGRPLQAGLWLAIGTAKVQTMLPFLLLFHRRRDLPAWGSLAVCSLGLALLGSPPAELFTRLQECLQNIATLASPGYLNNYPSEVCFDVIGFNRALHFLGVHDRGLVQAGALVLVLALGAWVAWRCLGRRAWAAAPATALVALYASLFLYHRLYDMVLLALPLVYVFGRARAQRGVARGWYAGAALALFGVLYVRLETVKALSEAAMVPGADLGWKGALLVPCAVWLLLLTVVCLEGGERWAQRDCGLRIADCRLSDGSVVFESAVQGPQPAIRAEPARVQPSSRCT
jgi:hypothetical protein